METVEPRLSSLTWRVEFKLENKEITLVVAYESSCDVQFYFRYCFSPFLTAEVSSRVYPARMFSKTEILLEQKCTGSYGCIYLVQNYDVGDQTCDYSRRALIRYPGDRLLVSSTI